MLILQQAENISDRRMERYLRYNLGAKYFCGFNLTEATPDHSYFGKLRKRIGTEKIADLFNSVTQQLEKKGIVSNVFSFIDSTAIISKISLWEEYDKAHEKESPSSLHNGNVFKYALDRDARIGCKGKNKFWFGYKRHQRVDMKSGIITKIKITPANQTDAKAGIEILPEQGMVVADKGYDTNDFHEAVRSKNLHNGVIKRTTEKIKIETKIDGFHQLECLTLDALVQNFKCLMKIDCPIRIT
jgi:transposase, IS5 family